MFCSAAVYKVSYIVLLGGRVVHPVSVRPILGEVLLTQLQVCFRLTMIELTTGVSIQAWITSKSGEIFVKKMKTDSNLRACL